MEATKEYHGETNDIQKALEKMDGKRTIIPVFTLTRFKTHTQYYTCITPEANQFLINYLKTREDLSMDDKLFEISERGVTTAFESVNDTLGWGMVNGKNRFFASHQLRRFNATTIGETRFGDMIHGRVFSKTTQAYYKQNPTQIKEDYKKYIEALTIYEVNRKSY